MHRNPSSNVRLSLSIFALFDGRPATDVSCGQLSRSMQSLSSLDPSVQKYLYRSESVFQNANCCAALDPSLDVRPLPSTQLVAADAQAHRFMVLTAMAEGY